jgi:hypothetical protein
MHSRDGSDQSGNQQRSLPFSVYLTALEKEED